MINADLMVLEWLAGAGGQKTGREKNDKKQLVGGWMGRSHHVVFISFPFNRLGSVFFSFFILTIINSFYHNVGFSGSQTN